jgi:3,4-dihydroxy-2-butanone 4-phosphate synthase
MVSRPTLDPDELDSNWGARRFADRIRPSCHEAGSSGYEITILLEPLATPVIGTSGVTPELIGMMVRFGSGVICVSVPGSSLERLRLPPMTAVNEDLKDTANTVSVDARHGITTRLSAADRSRTIRILADERSGPEDLNRPGHVFPLRGVPGGVLRRAGHTEASLDFVRLAGLPSAGVICELVNYDGSLMRDLGVRSIRLLTNNPAKRAALEELGIHVSGCEPLQVPAHPTNISYLRTKRNRLGHLLTGWMPRPRRWPLQRLHSIGRHHDDDDRSLLLQRVPRAAQRPVPLAA